MASLGDLVAVLKLDSGGFDRGAKRARQNLKGLSGGVSRLVKDIAVLAGAGTAIGGLFAGFKLAGDAELAQVAFSTMLGDAEKARGVLAELEQFAASTPFQLNDLIAAAKNLTAVKIGTEELLPTLRRIGDVAAVTGTPLSELVDNFAKIKAVGRASLLNVNSFAIRAIPIYETLERVTGKTREEIRVMASEGKIRFREMNEALKLLTGQGGQFQGGMAKAAATLPGLWSTMKDNLGFTLQELAEQIIETFDIRDIVAGLTSGLQSLRAGLQDFAPLFSTMGKAAIAYLSALLAIKAATLAWAAAMKVATLRAVLLQAATNPALLLKLAAGAAVAITVFRKLDGSVSGVAASSKGAADAHERHAAGLAKVQNAAAGVNRELRDMVEAAGQAAGLNAEKFAELIRQFGAANKIAPFGGKPKPKGAEDRRVFAEVNRGQLLEQLARAAGRLGDKEQKIRGVAAALDALEKPGVREGLGERAFGGLFVRLTAVRQELSGVTAEAGKLQAEIDRLKLGEDGALEKKLKGQGATEDDLNALRQMRAEIKRLEADRAAFDEADERRTKRAAKVAELKEQLETPVEAFAKRMDELKTFREELGEDVFARGARKARDQLRDALGLRADEADEPGETKFAQALTRGSSAAISAILRAGAQNNPQQKANKELEKANAKLADANKHLMEIGVKIDDNAAANIEAF